MSKPLAGEVIALRCPWFILGTSSPLLLEETSNMEEGSGVVIPIPTLPVCEAALWAANVNAEAITTQYVENFFFITEKL